MTLAFLFSAGPAPVLLHAFDHVVNFHHFYSHDVGSESDSHHDSHHNHEQIFSLQTLPSVVSTSTLGILASERKDILSLIDVDLFAGHLTTVHEQEYRSQGPPIQLSSILSLSPFLNRAPPLA